MGGGFTMIFTLVLLGGMLFFMSRSQKKQQKERQATLDSMKIGDSVVTIGGLHGVISDFDESKKTILIDCEGIILEFDRAAIKAAKPGVTVTNDDNVTVVEETKVDEIDHKETIFKDNKTKE